MKLKKRGFFVVHFLRMSQTKPKQKWLTQSKIFYWITNKQSWIFIVFGNCFSFLVSVLWRFLLNKFHVPKFSSFQINKNSNISNNDDVVIIGIEMNNYQSLKQVSGRCSMMTSTLNIYFCLHHNFFQTLLTTWKNKKSNN